MALLQCADLVVGYTGRHGWKEVVHGVSFEIARGSTFALVGESGSGKSTIAKAIVRLVPLRSGSIRWQGTELAQLNEAAFRPWRRRIQMVFQDPWGSLNPRATAQAILEEPLKVHFPSLNAASRRLRVRELLDAVHLPAAAAARFPKAFSGGQRQRILIARALAVEPELLVCDEPLSALDVSTQAEILDLLAELKQSKQLTLLFISHDLGVVHAIADQIGVLESGNLVEMRACRDLFKSPVHPYTRQLLDAVPRW